MKKNAILALAFLGLMICGGEQTPVKAYEFLDYHFRAGDGGAGASGVEDGTPQEYGYNWRANTIGPDVISATIPGSASGPGFSGLDTMGNTATNSIGVVYDGRVSLYPNQAAADASGRGGNVVINLEDANIANLSQNSSRYFFTAGNADSSGGGGNVIFKGTEYSLGASSAFIFTSGADSGGRKGGSVDFGAEILNLTSAAVFFKQPANSGIIQSAIGDLYAFRDTSISYEGTSNQYNTIENIHLRTAAKLTLYGTAGSRDSGTPGGNVRAGNYTADGARISVLNGSSPTYLNIQAGSIQASSLTFERVVINFATSRPYPTAALYINHDSTSSNPGRPEKLDDATPLGKLDLTGLRKEDIVFTFYPDSLISTAVGETFQLIKGRMGDGTYLEGLDYGTFARNMGAQMYLFNLDGSTGDLLLTYMGMDGGFTHYIKSYFEGRAAEATTVIAGGQFVADSVIANARLKARLNETTSSLSVGASKIKTKTGSYVENDNYNAALSVAYLFELGPGRMLFGAFVEAGRGRYDYFHNYNPAAPQNNDGKSDYYGGGAFARYEFPVYQWDGFYAEASMRAGKIDNQFNGLFGTESVTFDNHSSYYGGHFGLGKVFSLTDRTGLDLYAKGFYNAVESGGVMTSSKENLDFDRVESITTRIGGRLTHQFTEQFVAYVGGSWEKEHNGRVDGTYLGKDYDFGTSLKGDSGIGEIGFNLQPSYLPLEVELSAFGKGGQQEGFGGSLSLKYTY